MSTLCSITVPSHNAVLRAALHRRKVHVYVRLLDGYHIWTSQSYSLAAYPELRCDAVQEPLILDKLGHSTAEQVLSYLCASEPS